MSPTRKNLQTSIPTVGALCEKLGYGKGKNEVTGLSKNDLTETTQVWRKKYTTPGGKPGRELKDWKSAAERQELLLMATRYLDDDGNGERFWPNNSEDDAGKQLRYPADEEKISRILRQLFWKQNYYDVHNAREERKRASRERSLSGLTSNDPIIVDSVESDITKGSGKTPPPKYTERASQQNPSTKWSHETDFSRTFSSFNFTPKVSLKAANMPSRKHTVGSSASQSAQASHPRAQTGQEPPNVYDDIEGGHGAASLRRPHPVRTPPRAPPALTSNSYPGSKSTRDQQGNDESPSQGRAIKRQKNYHRGDTTRQSFSQGFSREEYGAPLRQSERTPKRRVLPNVASPEEVAALLEGSAADVKTNRKYSFVESADESPSPEPMHTYHAPAKKPHVSFVQQPKEQSSSGIRGPSQSGQAAGATGPPQTQAESPVIRTAPAPAPAPAATTTTTTATPQIRIEAPRPSAADPNPSSSSLKAAQAPASEPHATKPPPTKPPTEPKSRIDVDFWIIKAKKPRLECERWREGMLRGKTLSYFIEGAARITQSRCIEELRCTLQTFDRRTTETVHRADEPAFEKMRDNFTNLIKAAWEKDRNGKENFEVWIEPVYGEDQSVDGEGEIEDLELGDF